MIKLFWNTHNQKKPNSSDKKIREKKLRDVITSQEAQFWKFISRNVYLSKDRIELDKRLLKNYYRNKGYYEVDVKSTNVEYSEGEGFVLTYNVNAGKRYKFKKIFANVSETLDKEAFLSLENRFSKLAGEYYSQRKLKRVLDEIDKLVTSYIATKPDFQCQHCGFTSHTIYWNCPSCKHWETIVPSRGLDGF